MAALIALQDEYRAWLDSLPDNLEGSRLADKLQAIAEIVHDIDLKDGKFKREEATGIARLIAGIAMANKDDEQRIAQGAPVFDNLYQYFRTKRG